MTAHFSGMVERSQIEPFTHIGMTAHFSGMVERSQIEPFTHIGMTAHFSGMVYQSDMGRGMISVLTWKKTCHDIVITFFFFLTIVFYASHLSLVSSNFSYRSL
jgi:hypothetical protein